MARVFLLLLLRLLLPPPRRRRRQFVAATAAVAVCDLASTPPSAWSSSAVPDADDVDVLW